ncbi:MAG TPA: hypothetical protein VLH59_09170 [Ignavibacteriaceae bacterium]|nr:hypothetical protein [Ignavibacteriaceae bacterium]
MKTKLILSFLFIILSITACNTTEPPPPPPDGEKPTLALALDDASCTEAWLQLTTKDLELPAELTLKQYNPTGDSLSKIFLLNTQDSLLYIDSLLPNKSYSFIASHSGLPSGSSGISSNQLSVTTMDTTSHNFTFESWTFGTIGSSTLYDVAIINENNIWAVGEILIADTSQNGYTTYNAVHWDGSQWELKRIPYYDYGGYLVYGPLQTVFAFTENDVWFCSYANLLQYNGSDYLSRAFFMTSITFNGQVLKIWGTDANNIYCVGRNGALYHFYGTGWSRIESGTDLNINDIWGDYNEKTGEWEVLAVASNYGTSLEKEILLIKDNVVINIPPSSQMWPLLTTWFISNRQYYVAGAGIYQKRLLIDELWVNNATDITTFATTSIRGNNINDVIGVGAFGDLVHYNGLSWETNYEPPNLSYGSYKSVGIKGDIIYAVGDEYSQAVILKIKR